LDYAPGRYAPMPRILGGESVPPAVYSDHVFIDAQNVRLYYPERPAGSRFQDVSLNIPVRWQ
jgi:hypothetical protein